MHCTPAVSSLLADDTQKAGAGGELLVPISHQKLSADKGFGHSKFLTRNLSAQPCVYDSPGTPHFELSNALHARIAQLQNTCARSIFGLFGHVYKRPSHIYRASAAHGSHVTIGISGAAFGTAGLQAGCQSRQWAIGGVLLKTALATTCTAQAGGTQEATRF